MCCAGAFFVMPPAGANRYGQGGSDSRTGETMAAKNLLMFSIDDMRSLDNWGNFSRLISTPNMDALADRGTTFDRAINQVPLCNPSRTSVFSGLQPSETGVLDNDVRWWMRPALCRGC
ncbi:MAG: sulfatase-like hydrolase/transferase [Rhodobacteraceae bacterium]|nr:sulfatase-like hydrolase/transferase [Paracoccaceae bacterium]